MSRKGLTKPEMKEVFDRNKRALERMPATGANTATCKATITAKEVAVEGRIDGNVEAGDRIELKPTGVVTGDIVAARMTMAEGASINGHCHIGPAGQPKAASTTEPKPEAAATPAVAKPRAVPVKSTT